MLPVRAVDQVPAGAVLVRRVQAVLEDPLHAAVIAREPLVLGGDTPARGPVRPESAHALALQLRTNVQVHLRDRDAVGHEHALETADALDFTARERDGTTGLEDRAPQEVLVPPGMQDGDAAPGRNRPPVAPQWWTLAFDVVRGAEAVGSDELRVEPSEQVIDDLTAAGGRNTRDDERHRACLALAQLELRLEQPVLELRQRVLVLEAREAPALQDLVQPASRHVQT